MTSKAVNVGTPGHIDHGASAGASELKAMLSGPKSQYVHGWSGFNRTCAMCGTVKSVKYDFDGKEYCNLCILAVSFK